MALVIAKRRLCFSDHEGVHVTHSLDRAQIFPDRLLDHPYFQSAQRSGWIDLIYPVIAAASTTGVTTSNSITLSQGTDDVQKPSSPEIAQLIPETVAAAPAPKETRKGRR